MIFVYGFCDGNSVQAVADYQTEECLLEFTRHCEIPVHFPAFALQPSVMLMKVSMKKIHVRVREELQDVFVFPTWECGEHCMQRACIHTTCSECNISDLEILLRGSIFASGSMAVASCVVTSCLLTNRNSIDGVNNTQTLIVGRCESTRHCVKQLSTTF